MMTLEKVNPDFYRIIGPGGEAPADLFKENDHWHIYACDMHSVMKFQTHQDAFSAFLSGNWE